MNNPTEAMKAMAERIGNEFAPFDDTATGCAIAVVVRKAVLAAIIETQRRDAEVAESIEGVGLGTSASWAGWRNAKTAIAAAIRTGNQYGKAEG